MRKRLLCFVMILSVILNLMMLPIFAEESKEELKCSCKVACKDTEGGKNESCDLCKSNIKNCAVIEKDGFLFNKSSGTITGVKNKDDVKGEVIIPDSIDSVPVTSIGDKVFTVCKDLTSITIPSSVTSIGDFAFAGCEGLKSVVIKTTKDSVMSIGNFAFNGCISLSSINIPDNMTSIGESVFASCISLTSITIPSSVESIGDYAFSCCMGLTSITIPSSVISIGNYAFFRCEKLPSTVEISSSVKLIGESAFAGCTGINEFKVDESNEVYSSKDGVIFNKECSKLLSFPSGNSKYMVSNGVKEIGASAFAYSNLTSIIIPSSVESIGNYAFFICEKLKDAYYIGSESEWDKVEIGIYNHNLHSNLKFVNIGFPSNLIYNLRKKEAKVDDYKGSDKISIKYYDESGKEKDPVEAGTYTVKLDIGKNHEDVCVGQFTILKAENKFIEGLSIEDWTYGEEANKPTAKAEFGIPMYTYSTEEKGKYTETVPTEAGTYWVKATVAETSNYGGLESKIKFKILSKANTVISGSSNDGNKIEKSGVKDVDFVQVEDNKLKTGDSRDMRLWLVLFIASGSLVVVVRIYKKSRKEKEKFI